jgi:transcriptional regulator with PAS, ATPase and Fis domain
MNNPNRAIESYSGCSTDISVLVIGESGVGKESIPKIYIHCLIENMEIHRCKLWCYP